MMAETAKAVTGLSDGWGSVRVLVMTVNGPPCFCGLVGTLFGVLVGVFSEETLLQKRFSTPVTLVHGKSSVYGVRVGRPFTCAVRRLAGCYVRQSVD